MPDALGKLDQLIDWMAHNKDNTLTLQQTDPVQPLVAREKKKIQQKKTLNNIRTSKTTPSGNM